MSLWLATSRENPDEHNLKGHTKVLVYFNDGHITADANGAVQADQLQDLKVKGKFGEWQYFEIIFEAKKWTDLAVQVHTHFGVAVDGVCLVPWPSPDRTENGLALDGPSRLRRGEAASDSIMDPYRHDDNIGDLDFDLDVDTDDLALLQAAFGTAEGALSFNADADLDADGAITLADYQEWFDDYLDFHSIELDDPDSTEANVVVRCEPESLDLAVGDTATVRIVADIPTRVLGWGLDLNLGSPDCASLIGTPQIGPAWTQLTAPDGDGLAACAFPTEQQGNEVLLATIRVRGNAEGVTTLTPGATAGDLTEGIALAPFDFDSTTFVPATIIVGNCAAAPPGLVSWWRLNGDSHDEMHRNDGQLIDVPGRFRPGKVDSGYSPSGVGKLIRVADSPTLNPATFTLDAWVRIDSLPNANVALLEKGDPFGTAKTSPLSLDVYGTYDPALAGHAIVTIGDGTTYQELRSATTVPTGRYFHIAATADGSSLRLYLDGELSASANELVTPQPSAYPFQIGGIDGPGAANPGPTLIDETEIHNQAATPEQIRAIYQAGSLGKCLSTPIAVAPRSPSELRFVRAVPDPLSGRGAFQFALPKAGHVRLSIYDIAGRLVRKIADGVMPAGNQLVQWDGYNTHGNVISAGVYLVRLETPAGTRTGRFVVLK
jgi:hypothetical protein